MEFKNNLINLINKTKDLIDIDTKNRSMISGKNEDPIVNSTYIAMSVGLINMTNNNYLIEEFIKRTYTSWYRIKERDYLFFKDNIITFFKDLNNDSIPIIFCNKIANFLVEKDEEGNFKRDLEYYWIVLDKMVIYCINHIWSERKPFIFPGEDSIRYDKNYLSDVKLMKIANTWNVKLSVGNRIVN